MIFVVDACIARSMGGSYAVNELSKMCHGTMMQIYDKKHKIAVSKELLKEYDKHQSSYFYELYKIMLSKNCVEFVKDYENFDLRDHIESCIHELYQQIDEREAITKIICKDVHLFESALVTDKFIISNENNCKKHLIRIIDKYGDKFNISSIYWVVTDDRIINWLIAGSNPDEILIEWKFN